VCTIKTTSRVYSKPSAEPASFSLPPTFSTFPSPLPPEIPDLLPSRANRSALTHQGNSYNANFPFLPAKESMVPIFSATPPRRNCFLTSAIPTTTPPRKPCIKFLDISAALNSPLKPSSKRPSAHSPTRSTIAVPSKEARSDCQAPVPLSLIHPANLARSAISIHEVLRKSPPCVDFVSTRPQPAFLHL
jgi:hypothetical protein